MFFLDEFVDIKSFKVNRKKLRQWKILEKYSRKTSIIGADNAMIECVSKSKQYIVGSNLYHHQRVFIIGNLQSLQIIQNVLLLYVFYVTPNDKKLDLIHPSFGIEELPEIGEPIIH